jgi:methanogenic corrinoid protein MtbC1
MISEILFLEYLSYLLDGDKKKCMAIVTHLMEERTDIKVLYKDLFQRSLYQVGKMWENNRICVATEHVATSITENLMNYVNIPPKITGQKKNKVVITCAPKEFHQVGAKMVANIFEHYGWDTFFVGANTPTTELLKLLSEKKPHLLAVSITFYLNVLKLLELISTVREKNTKLPIIVGGQALAKEKSEILNKFKDVTYICSLKDLENFTINFKSVSNH